MREDGLHVNMVTSFASSRLPWDILGATMGLAMLSLCIMPGCPRPVEGVAVFGELRTDGSITGTLNGLTPLTVQLAHRHGWRRMFVPSTEVRMV